MVAAAAAELGIGGRAGVERDDRGVRDAGEGGVAGARAAMHRGADHHAVTDDERRQLAARSTSARAASTRTSCSAKDSPPGNAKSGSAAAKASNARGVLGTHVGEEAVRPVAGVGLHQARVLDRLEAGPRGDGVGRFAGAQQRAAPQRRELVGDGALGQLERLRAADVVERDLLLALEAPLAVVGGLAVAGEEDAAVGLLGQDRSKRSRSMTLCQAAAKSRTSFSSASSLA